MAAWLSSKLKQAEKLLNQVDKAAADTHENFTRGGVPDLARHLAPTLQRSEHNPEKQANEHGQLEDPDVRRVADALEEVKFLMIFEYFATLSYWSASNYVLSFPCTGVSQASSVGRDEGFTKEILFSVNNSHGYFCTMQEI